MPIFALWPSGARTGGVVWVNAEDETQARRLLARNLETHAAATDRMAFYCVSDESHSPPPGLILVEGGAVHVIRDPGGVYATQYVERH